MQNSLKCIKSTREITKTNIKLNKKGKICSWNLEKISDDVGNRETCVQEIN